MLGSFQAAHVGIISGLATAKRPVRTNPLLRVCLFHLQVIDLGTEQTYDVLEGEGGLPHGRSGG